MPSQLFVTKADGEREPLDIAKLERSLERAGAGAALAARIAKRVTDKVADGIHTDKLYRIAFRALRKQRRHVAARYSLKRAVMQLGPTGYPFEHLVAALLEMDGWHTQVGVTLQGAVPHEIDVVADYAERAEARRLLVECKHRSAGDAKCDVKTALYVSARARDLLGDLHNNPNQFWLATNGRFTQDAIAFAKSVNLGLLGWDWPQRAQAPDPNTDAGEKLPQPELHLPVRSLSERITDALAFPVTCLTTLKQRHKAQLLNERVVLCRELEAKPELLNKLRLSPAQLTELRRELFDLLHPLSLDADAEA